MVKNIQIQATKAPNLPSTRSNFNSDFIVPGHDLSDEAILDLSTPREVAFTPEQALESLQSDQFVYFIDYVQKGRIATGTEEMRLTDSEIQTYSRMVDTIVHVYRSEQPVKPIPPEEDMYLQAFLKSPYQQDLVDFFTNYPLPELEKSKAKALHLSYVQKQQVAQIKKRHRAVITKLAGDGLTEHQIAQHFDLKYKPEIIKLLLDMISRYGSRVKISGQGAKVTPEIESAVLKLAGDPDSAQLSLQEIEELVTRDFGVKIGAHTVSCILKSNHFAKKKPTFAVPEADCVPHKNTRIKVVCKLLSFLLEGREIVSIDETQCQAGFLRTQVWAKKGSRCVLPAGRKGKPVHVIAAVWRHGVIGYMLRDERIKANSHVFFLSRLYDELKKMDPEHYKERFVVLMDNAGAHKKRLVKDFIESQGVTVLCNGPMTPHIQPIEYVFSLFKRELRRQKDSVRHRLNVLIGIYKSFTLVSKMKTEIYNIYQHTFKFYKPILRYENISSGPSPQSCAQKVIKTYLQLSEKPAIIELDN